MEKILVVINTQRINTAALEYACSIANLTQSSLTGVFVEEKSFEYIPSIESEHVSYFKNIAEKAEVENKVIITDKDQSIQIFTDMCTRKKVQFSVYQNNGKPIEEVIYESRFADLLIIDAETTFNKKAEGMPTHFVKEVLANAECPVIIAPNIIEEVNEIVFCYDGSRSSVFAIKQFTYLLPEFKNKKVTLLEINNSGTETFNEGHRRIMDWLRTHYTSVNFHGLEGAVKDEMFIYFFMKRNKLVVMGAYGRNMLSNFFKRSAAEDLIRTVDLPLFITHY